MAPEVCGKGERVCADEARVQGREWRRQISLWGRAEGAGSSVGWRETLCTKDHLGGFVGKGLMP